MFPGPGECPANLEDPGKVQPHGEQKPCDQGHEYRRLELEAPAGRAHSCGAESQKQGADGAESKKHSSCVSKGLVTHGRARPSGQLSQAQGLYRQNWKDTGHEIENQAAEEGEEEGTPSRKKLAAEASFAPLRAASTSR